MTWKDDQLFERNWWSDCANTYNEETKQLVYARKMGLNPLSLNGKYPVYDLKGASVLDIGGGPTSILLKCINKGPCAVIDPCSYPDWISVRYLEAKIDYYQIPAESMFDIGAFQPAVSFNETWCYNVLQHVLEPKKIIENAKSISLIIRLFEWINEPVSIGHPNVLTETNLNKWLGGEGKVEQLNESGCVGTAYYGIFRGDLYGKI